MHRLYDWLLRHILKIWRSAEKVYPKLQQKKKNNAKEDNSPEEKVSEDIAMGSLAPAMDLFFAKLRRRIISGLLKFGVRPLLLAIFLFAYPKLHLVLLRAMWIVYLLTALHQKPIESREAKHHFGNLLATVSRIFGYRRLHFIPRLK